MSDPLTKTDARPAEMRRPVVFYRHNLGDGGVQKMTVILANALVEAGQVVDIVVDEPGGRYRDALSDEVRVVVLAKRDKWAAYLALVRVDARSGVCELLRRLFPGRTRMQLARLSSLAAYLAERRPAVLFAAAPLPIHAVWAKKIARSDTPVVATIHSTLSERWAGRNVSGVDGHRRWRLYLKRLRRVVPECDAVLGISRGTLVDFMTLMGRPGVPAHAIYNPVVDETSAHITQAACGHPWLDVDTGIPVVLAVGRLAPVKRFADLLEAVALARRSRAIRLIILGEGPECAALWARARDLAIVDAFDMPGYRADVTGFMQRSAVFVLASESEALSNVLIEALACGCSVVATDCPTGPREVLDDGRYGQLVPVGDTAAMSQAILAALQTPAANMGPQRAAAFSKAASVAQYQALILALKPGR